MDMLSRTMNGMNNLIYDLEDDSHALCSQNHEVYTKYLIKIMNNDLKFNSRNEIMFQGDQFNLIICSWISILKSLMVRRSVFLEPNKLKNPINGRKSEQLRDLLMTSFMKFLMKMNLKNTKNVLGGWTIVAI